MKSLVLAVALALAVTLGFAHGQLNVKPLSKHALTAKTVAIINNTHSDAVSEGAEEALKRWGRFTIVDDSDLADSRLPSIRK